MSSALAFLRLGARISACLSSRIGRCAPALLAAPLSAMLALFAAAPLASAQVTLNAGGQLDFGSVPVGQGVEHQLSYGRSQRRSFMEPISRRC